MEEDEVENNISENLEKGNGKRDNKMASMPVNKLMLSMGIPMIYQWHCRLYIILLTVHLFQI